MRGKLWNELKPSYRARLSRAGITSKQHNHAVRTGKPLAAREKARGHSQTPEHPERANKPSNAAKYAAYKERKSNLQRRVINAKRELFGGRSTVHGTYTDAKNAKNVMRNPITKKAPTTKAMKTFLFYYDMGDFEEWWDDEGRYDDEYAFIYYH